MILLEYKQKANAILVNFWGALKTKQDAYFAKHGKYFQLLISPNSDVVDGVDSDYIIVNPSDEKHLADMEFLWVTKIPFQISVDEWVGETVGYSATVTAFVNGKRYKRRRDSDNSDTGWFEYLEGMV